MGAAAEVRILALLSRGFSEPLKSGILQLPNQRSVFLCFRGQFRHHPINNTRLDPPSVIEVV